MEEPLIVVGSQGKFISKVWFRIPQFRRNLSGTLLHTWWS